jgi:hypothetical protein
LECDEEKPVLKQANGRPSFVVRSFPVLLLPFKTPEDANALSP